MIKPVKDLQPLFPFLRPYRSKYLLGFGSLLAEVVFWVAVPQIIRQAIDTLQSQFDVRMLIRYSGLLLGAALCKAFFLFWSRMTLIGISRDVEFDLRNELYRHLSRQSMNYFQHTRVGDLMSRATNDLNAVRMLLGPGIMYSLRTIVILIGAATVMFRISFKLSIYSFVLVPIVIVVVSFFGHRIHERFESIQAMLSNLSAKVQESLSGIRILRAYAQEQADLSRFRALNEEFVDRNRKLIRIWGMFYPSLDMLMGLSFALVLWLGGREVVAGHISIGSFVAFNVYMAQLSWPMIALGWVVNIFQRGTASLRRLDEIFRTAPQISDGTGTAFLKPLRSNGNGATSNGMEIEFRNLSFAYDNRPILHNVNLTIPAGTTLTRSSARQEVENPLWSA